MRSQSICTIGSSILPAAPRVSTAVRDGRRRTRARCCWRSFDPGEREPLVRAVGELRRELPVARPALEQHPVEEDVGERRLVALVQRGVLGQVEVRRAPSKSSTYRSHWPSLKTMRVSTSGGGANASSSSARSAAARSSPSPRKRSARTRAPSASATSEGSSSSLPSSSSRAARAASDARTRSLVPAHIAIAASQRARRSGSVASRSASSAGQPRPTHLRASTRCRRARAAPWRACRLGTKQRVPRGASSLAGSRPRGEGGPRGRVAARRTRPDRR